MGAFDTVYMTDMKMKIKIKMIMMLVLIVVIMMMIMTINHNGVSIKVTNILSKNVCLFIILICIDYIKCF